MKLPRHFLLSLTALACGLTIILAIHESFAFTAAAPAGSPAGSPSSLLTRADGVNRVAGVGVIEPAGEVIALALQAGGVVSNTRVRPGDQVRAGDVLLVLDSREVEAELNVRRATEKSARRSLETLNAELREKSALLEMYRALQGSPALVEEELLRRTSAVDQLRARVAAAQAAIKEAQAASTLVQTKLHLLTLRAPVDGQVLQLRVRPGEWVQPGGASAAPVTLARQGPFQVRVDIDEVDVGRFVEGAPASVIARGAQSASVEARFLRAEPLLAPKRNLSNASDERVDTRVLQLLFELPPSAQNFRIGQQVDAFVAGRVMNSVTASSTGRPASAGAGATK